MKIVQKWLKIVDWQKNHLSSALATLNNPINNDDIKLIQALIDESLPIEFLQLYQYANGQQAGLGLLLGREFISAKEIISSLEFSRTLVKPEQRTIAEPQKTEQLLKQISHFYVEQINKCEQFKSKWWQSKNKPMWYKMKCSFSPYSFCGPYVYLTSNTKEYEVLSINDYSEIQDIVTELHQIEQQAYNWDELNFTIYHDSHYTVERINYDFDNSLEFTSTPLQAIKEKYFYYKWLPIFSDGGGNYIGIDLDPDTKGHKGQIINFGRDKQDMIVLAKNLGEFFECILQLMESKQIDNIEDIDLIDFLK